MDGPDDKYITSVAIRQRFGICNNTLRNWANAGKLSTVRLGGDSGKRLYKLQDVERAFAGYKPADQPGKRASREKVCYARVSSQKQKPDLERQVQALEAAFPGREIVKDIGSGINWKRPGLVSLLDRAVRGELAEIAVSHRDRLCRFAFELIEHMLHKCGCKIVVQDKADGAEEPISEESELKDDLLAIITVFVASNNGKRAAANRRARRLSVAKEEENGAEGEREEEEEGQERRGQGGEVPQMEDIPQ